MRRKPNDDGIEVRHSKLCKLPGGGKCNCKPSYRASVWDNANRHRHKKTCATLSEARAWRRDVLIALEAGALRVASPRTLAEEATDWLAGATAGTIRNRKGQPYKPSALRGYERVLRLRVLPVLGHVRFTELRRRDLQDYVDRMVAEGVNAATISKTLDPLRAMYRRALRRDEVTVNPTANLELPRPKPEPRRAASREEAAALVAAVPEMDRALWATGFYGGLRRGELRALRLSDLDLERNVIRVERSWDDNEGELEDGKTINAKRQVFIVPELRRELIEHKLRTGRSGDDLVFGRTASEPFVPSSVRRRAIESWRQARLEPVKLHEARYTWISMCIAAEVNPHTVMVAAGHGSYEMTMEHYGKLMPDALAQASARFEAYMAGGTTAGQSAPGLSGP